MGSHYGGTEEEVRALCALINLMRANETVTAALSRRVARERLTLSQFGVLEALFHLGPLRQSSLGKKLLRSSGDITMVTGNLEGRGLVVRARSDKDRRVVIVNLTPEGRRLIERMLPEHVALIAEDFSRLTADEQDELRRLCKKLGREPEGPLKD